MKYRTKTKVRYFTVQTSRSQPRTQALFNREKDGLIQAYIQISCKLSKRARVRGDDGGKEAPGRKCPQDGARIDEHVN